MIRKTAYASVLAILALATSGPSIVEGTVRAVSAVVVAAGSQKTSADAQTIAAAVPAVKAAPQAQVATGASPALKAELADLSCGEDDRCLAFVNDARSKEPSKKASTRAAYSFGSKTIDLTAWQIERERRCLAIAAFAEARNQGRLGVYAVMRTVINRVAASSKPTTPCDVVVAHGVLEAMHRRAFIGETRAIERGWMPRKALFKNVVDERVYKEALLIAYQATAGGLTEDPTHGATFYWSPTAQADLGRKAPAWIKNAVLTAELELHDFYRPAQGGDVILASASR